MYSTKQLYFIAKPEWGILQLLFAVEVGLIEYRNTNEVLLTHLLQFFPASFSGVLFFFLQSLACRYILMFTLSCGI